MLSQLWVKNFALIKEERITFSKGFHVFSGETGAGKSLLVEAIGLLLGEKASSDLIRHEEEESIVEGVFDFEKNHPVFKFLEDNSLNEDNELIIRRQITVSGKNQIYVNNRRCLLSTLKDLSKWLIDLSGQHEQQILLQKKEHLKILDLIGFKEDSYKKIYHDYQSIYKPYLEISHQIEKKLKNEKDKKSRIEFLEFQKKEIERAKIDDENEEDELVLEKNKVKHATSLHELASLAKDSLEDSSSSVINKIENIVFEVEKRLDKDDGLNEVLSKLNELKSLSVDCLEWFSDYQENISIDPSRLEEIESRLYQFYQLEKKYGHNLSEIKKYFKDISKELDDLNQSEEKLSELNLQREKLSIELKEKAKLLSGERLKIAKKLEKKVKDELNDLALNQVSFKVNFNPLKDFSKYGLDDLEFIFSANQGEKMGALTDVASGGELSRILLALKMLTTQSEFKMSYIFDEVDTGIGGGVAEMVGRKLKSLSLKNQVFCVTHLPQVASFSDHHYLIGKETKKSRTFTTIKKLSSEEKVMELARMLGGSQITDQTINHAKEMINMAS
jgi:DNA repair protein RecN (Recombination protein N)